MSGQTVRAVHALAKRLLPERWWYRWVMWRSAHEQAQQGGNYESAMTTSARRHTKADSAAHRQALWLTSQRAASRAAVVGDIDLCQWCAGDDREHVLKNQRGDITVCECYSPQQHPVTVGGRDADVAVERSVDVDALKAAFEAPVRDRGAAAMIVPIVKPKPRPNPSALGY